MAEARTVSVLMLDIEGSTPLVKQMGGEKYLYEFMPSFHAMLVPSIKRAGRIFQQQKELGDDCVKALFDSPQDAVAVAVEIQNPFRDYGVIHENGKAVQIKLHLAVHTCLILSKGSPDVAQIPDLARLLKLAKDGQILLSSACYATYIKCLTEKNIPPRECDKFDGYLFKGIEGEQYVYSLQYDNTRRGAPGLHYIGFEQVEAANEYIHRDETENAIVNKFSEENGERGGVFRFVTIHGEGGMGKTRLTLNCARKMVNRFPGGIAFVPLAYLPKKPTPDDVADALYHALHLPERNGEDVKNTKELLRLHFQNRHATLLLLDNAESIAFKLPVMEYLRELMDAVPQLRFLASSRRWCRLGDQEGRIDINDGLTPFEAFRLFSAQTARARAQPTERRACPMGTKRNLSHARPKRYPANHVAPTPNRAATPTARRTRTRNPGNRNGSGSSGGCPNPAKPRPRRTPFCRRRYCPACL